MPLYEYKCDACGHRLEIIQKFSDGAPDVCPKCGKGPVQRLQSSPAIQFKGSGWYVTDYAGKGKSGETGGGDGAKPADGKSDAPSGGDTGSATDTKKSDAKKSDAKKSDAPPAAPAASKD